MYYCYKFLAIIIFLCFFSFASQAIEKVNLLYNDQSPQISFGVNELQSVLGELKYVVYINSDQPSELVIELQSQLSPQLNDPVPANRKAESFSIRISSDRKKVSVTGFDDAGLMYGAMELAEILSTKGWKAINDVDRSPYMALRGVKFNIPLDERTPTYHAHTGDAQQRNVTVMWDLEFWKSYIDQLAKSRYNYLSLWSLHPFPSMVNVPGYEELALEDVYSVNDTIKMSMDEKIDFWRQVMRHAKSRNVAVFIVTWNIFIMNEDASGLAVGFDKEGMYGMTNRFNNPNTVDYMRKAVEQLVLTYPDLSGIGITAGERMRKTTNQQKEKWIFDTYGQGILDALKKQTDRKLTFVHRQHMTLAEDIMKNFQPLLDHPNINFIYSFKYAKAHVMSSTVQPYKDEFVKKIGDFKTLWTLRNDSNYYFRWGAPDFVREFILNIPYEPSAGIYYGADGFVWGREFISNEPTSPRQLEINKHWYHWLLWGYLSYDPRMPNERFVQILQHQYPKVDAEMLFDAWQNASMIYPLTQGFHWGALDFMFYIEGCVERRRKTEESKYHDINIFINQVAHPSTDNIRIKDYAELITKNEKITGTTPIETANQLHQKADKALAFVNKVSIQKDMELKRTIEDIRAMAYLGKFYAFKIQGGTELALFRRTKKVSHRTQSVKFLEESAKSWDLYVKAVLSQYITPIKLNRVGTVDFNKLTKEVWKDVEIARSNLETEPSTHVKNYTYLIK